MYYPCSENKDADQLRGYREADLRLCFRPCKLLVFSRTGSYINVTLQGRIQDFWKGFLPDFFFLYKLSHEIFGHIEGGGGTGFKRTSEPPHPNLLSDER